MSTPRLALAAITGALAAAALAPSAHAATRLVATATPATPQIDPAGWVQHVQVECAAYDRSSVRTTVSCWTTTSGSTATATLAGPAAFVQRRLPSDPLFYTLCASATFTYASGYQSSTGTRCAPADTGVAVVRG